MGDGGRTNLLHGRKPNSRHLTCKLCVRQGFLFFGGGKLHRASAIVNEPQGNMMPTTNQKAEANNTSWVSTSRHKMQVLSLGECEWATVVMQDVQHCSSNQCQPPCDLTVSSAQVVGQRQASPGGRTVSEQLLQGRPAKLCDLTNTMLKVWSMQSICLHMPTSPVPCYESFTVTSTAGAPHSRQSSSSAWSVGPLLSMSQ